MSIFLGTLENSNNLVLSNIFAWLSLFCVCVWVAFVYLKKRRFPATWFYCGIYKGKPQTFMEKLSGKHHLKWFLNFLPTSLKSLVAKADQKVNQGCENSLEKRSKFKSSSLLPSILFCLHFFWPTSNSVFLVAKKTFWDFFMFILDLLEEFQM